jgi:hypothetical protein
MIPFVGGSYTLDVRKADVQRTVNLFPVASENAGSAAPTYLQSIPGLDVFSDVPLPSSTLWLDTFDGADGTDLLDHAQNIPLNGSVWASFGETGHPFLNGAGSTRSTTGNGRPGAASSFSDAQIPLQSGWRYEFAVTPLQTVGDPGDAQTESLIIDSGSGSLFVRLLPIGESGSTFARAEVFLGDVEAPVTLELLSGSNEFVVLMETDGFTLTFNGVAQTKVVTTGMPVGPREFRFECGADFTAESPIPCTSIQRAAIFGVLA